MYVTADAFKDISATSESRMLQTESIVHLNSNSDKVLPMSQFLQV